MKLAYIFSSGSIFQHSSVLTLRGDCKAGVSVTARIMLGDLTVSERCAISAEDGSFAVSLTTPRASFDRYTVSVSADGETVLLDDVLFGELWLCSGQSNMELPNCSHEECEQIIDSLAGKHIRIYYAPGYPDKADHFIEPQRYYEGKWADSEDRETIRLASALATGFALKLYELLNTKGKTIPVGVLSLSKGASSVESWLIGSSYHKNPVIEDYMTRYGKHPDPATWNTDLVGDEYCRIKRTTAQYNYLIHPIIGVRVRGMLWYQGETNTEIEKNEAIYATLYKEMHDSYADILAADRDSFPIIASQLFPWAYTAQGSDCYVSYVNTAFTELMRAHPETYPAVPICDLNPRWAMTQLNHPIHPTHKYSISERMALVTARSFYGLKGQKLPASLSSVRRSRGRLLLRFDNVGTGLFVKGKRLRGIYIRSAKGVYTPAYAEIVNKSTLAVYHPDIKRPAEVAYGASSFEFDLNLYAGDFPVVPFITDLRAPTRPTIAVKSWLDLTLDSRLEIDGFTAEHRFCTRRPIFYPGAGSDICYDPDYGRYGRALRVSGDGKMSTYITACKYQPIDLENYSALTLSLYNTASLTCELKLTLLSENGEHREKTVVGTILERDALFRADVRFDLRSVKVGVCEKMELVFSFAEDSALNNSVAIEDIRLTPKA